MAEESSKPDVRKITDGAIPQIDDPNDDLLAEASRRGLRLYSASCVRCDGLSFLFGE